MSTTYSETFLTNIHKSSGRARVVITPFVKETKSISYF